MTQDTGECRHVTGRIVSTRMQKTVTVAVERLVKHELYKKYVRRTTKVHAHDADNSCQPGDLVAIVQCRPISRTKAWRVIRVLSRNPG